jgi:hypothetical protein
VIHPRRVVSKAVTRRSRPQSGSTAEAKRNLQPKAPVAHAGNPRCHNPGPRPKRSRESRWGYGVQAHGCEVPGGIRADHRQTALHAQESKGDTENQTPGDEAERVTEVERVSLLFRAKGASSDRSTLADGLPHPHREGRSLLLLGLSLQVRARATFEDGGGGFYVFCSPRSWNPGKAVADADLRRGDPAPIPGHSV